MLDNKVLTDWASLNPTERYFALFHSWWFRGSAEIIGESSRDYYNGLYDSLNFFLNTLGDSLSVKEKPHHFDYLRYSPGFQTKSFYDQILKENPMGRYLPLI